MDAKATRGPAAKPTGAGAVVGMRPVAVCCKRWMLHCGRLLDGSCVAVAAAVDRCGAAFCGHCGLSCCYADVDVVSVVWVRVGDCFRVAPVSLPATSHTHPWYTFPLRPHEFLATSASAVVTIDGCRQQIREREKERRRPTPSSSPAEPRIQRSRQKRDSLTRWNLSLHSE